MGKAILRGKKVVPVEDLHEWAREFESKDRILAQTMVGDCKVSTVFLGIDHGFGERPKWFETMIFGGESNEEYQERYETWEEAKAGHIRAVESIGGYFFEVEPGSPTEEPVKFLEELKNL